MQDTSRCTNKYSYTYENIIFAYTRNRLDLNQVYVRKIKMSQRNGPNSVHDILVLQMIWG